MYKRSLKWDRKGGRGDSGQLYQSRMRGEELGGGNDPVKVCQESREREREKREKAGTAQPAQIPHSKAFWAHSCASSTPYSQAKRVDVKTSHSIILHYFSQIKCLHVYGMGERNNSSVSPGNKAEPASTSATTLYCTVMWQR